MKTFAIFDINKPLMSDYPVINAKTGSEAIKQYCKQNYPDKKPKCSGSNYVQLSTQECTFNDGKMYILGYKRQTWYELINK